jgi:hypothetical protein
MGAQTNAIEFSINNAPLLINRFSVKSKVVAIVCVDEGNGALIREVRGRHEILQEPDIGQRTLDNGSESLLGKIEGPGEPHGKHADIGMNHLRLRRSAP